MKGMVNEFSNEIENPITAEKPQGYLDCETNVIIGWLQSPKGLQSVYSASMKDV
jgi:hypothetical protein